MVMTAQPNWRNLDDEALLDWRISDLGLRMDGVVAACVAQLHKELKAKNLVLMPPCHIGDEWFCPEGCAAILWRSAEHREKAATALRLTSKDLMELEICDEVIDEPLGGAHTDWDTTAERVGDALERHLHELSALSPEALLEGRWAKYAAIGVWYEA